MFISIPVIVVIVIVLAWCNSQTEADKLIEEMRDPGGFKRQALLDSARADKEARKAARGPAGAIIGGILTLGALICLVIAVWGTFPLLCLAWGLGVTLALSGIVVAANKLGLRLGYTILGLMLIPFTIEGIKCLLAVLR